jgi:cytoplasmic iron level regulating protein YaaA (DUF328/UPF0246 family)
MVVLRLFDYLRFYSLESCHLPTAQEFYSYHQDSIEKLTMLKANSSIISLANKRSDEFVTTSILSSKVVKNTMIDNLIFILFKCE